MPTGSRAQIPAPEKLRALPCNILIVVSLILLKCPALSFPLDKVVTNNHHETMTKSKAVGFKEVKTHLSSFIKEVAATGLRLLVTDRGKVVAQITTSDPHTGNELLTEGEPKLSLEPRVGRRLPLEASGIGLKVTTSKELLNADRGE